MKIPRFLIAGLFLAGAASSLYSSGTVWSEVADNVAYVHHDKADFNCCPAMAFERNQDGTSIDIYELDQCTNPCLCDCVFDFTHKFKGLLPGTYTARVWESSRCDDKYSLAGITTFKIVLEDNEPENQSAMSECGGWSGSSEKPFPEIPRLYSERQAVGEIEIHYVLPRTSSPVIMIYNATGERVRTFIPGSQPAGDNSLTWDTRTDGGLALPRGIYFVRLEVLGFGRSLPVVVLR